MNSVARSLPPSINPNTLLFHLQKLPVSSPRELPQIQAQILTNGCLHASTPLIPQFLSSCLRYLGLHYSLLFLQHFPNPSPSLWNLIIRSSAEASRGLQFLGIYSTMCRENIPPDKVTLSILLRSCVVSSGEKAGEGIHCQILKLGFMPDVFLRTGLLDFYSKTGRLSLAKQAFEEMSERDVVACNAMIAALSKHRLPDDARKLFDEMSEKSSASWNSMVTCYCRCHDIDRAREIFDRNPFKDIISWNAMIDGYCKLGQMAMAREFFDLMGSEKNQVTWNTLIMGYVHHREFGSAISLFRQMQAENVRPTEVTMTGLLSACAHLGALDMGRWIDAYIYNHKIKVDVVLGNALIDMYSKCGSIESALKIFHCMPTKNIFCWNSIITGLGMHGYGKQAIESFLEMIHKWRIKPDGVTFVGLLSSCSHSGLVSEGRIFFLLMQTIYAVEPQIEHYGCMVDLLGRVGFLKEALDLISTMPMKPNSIVWGSLLHACRIHKNAKVGEQVTQCLLELDATDGGNYVFLANMYASLNRWDDVEICRKTMVRKGVRKSPGCSYTVVDNMVHEFVVGDTSHPQFLQVCEYLDEMSRELTKLGDEPLTSYVLHDIEDEEIESQLKDCCCFWTRVLEKESRS